MKEIWKNVVGYEGLYEVSNLGMVKRLESSIIRNDGVIVNIKSKIMKVTNSGYSQLSLSKNGKNKTHYVSTLVATAFIDNPDNCKFVHNLNEDKTDNRVENLFWSESKCDYRKKLCERYVNYIKENIGQLTKYSIMEDNKYLIDNNGYTGIPKNIASPIPP